MDGPEQRLPDRVRGTARGHGGRRGRRAARTGRRRRRSPGRRPVRGTCRGCDRSRRDRRRVFLDFPSFVRPPTAWTRSQAAPDEWRRVAPLSAITRATPMLLMSCAEQRVVGLPIGQTALTESCWPCPNQTGGERLQDFRDVPPRIARHKLAGKYNTAASPVAEVTKLCQARLPDVSVHPALVQVNRELGRSRATRPGHERWVCTPCSSSTAHDLQERMQPQCHISFPKD